MSQYKFTAALNAASFPFVSRYKQRSTLIGQFDGKLRDPAAVPTTFLDNNPSNIPQILYCENVMPTVEGIKSVGYQNLQPPFPGVGVPDDVILLHYNSDSWYYSPAQGMNYVTPVISNLAFSVPWVSTSPLAGAPLVPDYTISSADVNGQTFICFGGFALLRWDGAAFTDVSGALIGIAIAGIRAICGSGNYLIVVYSDNSVKWSSLTNPLDFTPSTATGAGSQIPVDIKGAAVLATSLSGGFLIHCAENTVAALYTNNAAQPWIFREVKNSGGVFHWRDVAREASTGLVYIFSTYGMQTMNLREAENIHPNLTEFIGAKIIETFDPVTNLMTVTRPGAIYCKLSFLNGRYLCLSYNDGVNYTGPFKYILIYDYTLRRWGKLKVDHYDIFQSAEVYPNILSPADALLILKTDGSCDKIMMDDAIRVDSGVVILGKYQIARGYRVCSEELELEVTDANEAPTVFVACDYNGTTVGQINQMILYESVDNYKHYQMQIEGMNLSYIIKGTFNLPTVLLTVTKGGDAA